MKPLNGSNRNRGRSSNHRSGIRNKKKYLGNNTDSKFKGNALQAQGRYEGLARDASSAGDRVSAENFLQHAEHYLRINKESRPNNNISKEPSKIAQKNEEQPTIAQKNEEQSTIAQKTDDTNSKVIEKKQASNSISPDIKEI